MKNRKEEPTIHKRLSRPHPAARIFVPEFYTDSNVRAEIFMHLKYRKRHEKKVCGCNFKSRDITCNYGIFLELPWLHYKDIEEQFATFFG